MQTTNYFELNLPASINQQIFWFRSVRGSRSSLTAKGLEYWMMVLFPEEAQRAWNNRFRRKRKSENFEPNTVKRFHGEANFRWRSPTQLVRADLRGIIKIEHGNFASFVFVVVYTSNYLFSADLVHQLSRPFLADDRVAARQGKSPFHLSCSKIVTHKSSVIMWVTL